MKTNRLTLTAFFIALAAFGAYIIIPGPTGSIALDSAPAFNIFMASIMIFLLQRRVEHGIN